MTEDVQLHVGGLEAWPKLGRLEARLRRAARLALRSAGEPLAGQMSVAFLDSSAMRALNRRWLGRDRVTDVIAFDLGEGPAGENGGDRGDEEAGGLRAVVGDVYVCPDAARSAAAESGGPTEEEELVRLVVHGVLHVLGHEHPEDESRWSSPMYRLQEKLVARVLQDSPDEEAQGKSIEP